jgi:DNA polymerase III subunit alpha
VPGAVDLDRVNQYLRYLVEVGGLRRYGRPDWKTPERTERLEYELGVIEAADYSSTFIMLADVMDFCRRENILVGPGRGSAGGSYVCYCVGIHDADSIEWDLPFERFLNPERVSFPDVDVDVSQRDRQRVLKYIVEKYSRDDQVVLQVGAFVRAGGRAVVDLVATAMAQDDLNAWATATNLKKCFPDKGSITGGQKIQRELHAWLFEEKGHGDKEQFLAIAMQAGWIVHEAEGCVVEEGEACEEPTHYGGPLLKLDSMFTHLGKHAAGVVILSKDDLPLIPTVEVRDDDGGHFTVTAYDMYALDDLAYLKWDWLGLRTLDVIADAHRFIGGDGSRESLIALWEEHRDDPAPYPMLQEADTVGIFQMETDGYRRTLRDFKPTEFEHIVQLVALYRPGAIDYRREDGKNMVQVFIDRMHGREPVTYDHPSLRPILEKTHGIILYQEQSMLIARALAGFTLAQADALRKAIGKKRPEEMAKLVPLWEEGVRRNGIEPAVAQRVWSNIEAAARYSWNRSHAVLYAIITWWTAWFKSVHPAAFYAAEINSREKKKEVQANVIGEARQHTTFRPPDVNVAEDRFIVEDDEIVFGLNGLKGMGDAGRNELLVERMINGPFASYEDFCTRLPSFQINLKLALIKCGAFDRLESREHLLAQIPKGAGVKWLLTFECGCTKKLPKPVAPHEAIEMTCAKKGPEHEGMVGVSCEEIFETWTVAEHINHNRNLKTPRPLPEDLSAYVFPTDTQLAAGEMEAMGYYISAVPLAAVTKALARHSPNVIGGEVGKVTLKIDRNSDEYGLIQLITPTLTKQTLMMFASNWRVFGSRIEQGAQLLFRGREDGGKFLADACWPPDDVRHFKLVKVWRDGAKPETRPFDGEIDTLRALESAGFKVRLL